MIRWLICWCTFDLAHQGAAGCNLVSENSIYLHFILIIYTHNCIACVLTEYVL